MTQIGISPNRIAEIVNNRGAFTADTALLISPYFGIGPAVVMIILGALLVGGGHYVAGH
jgi:plasmid maintenance system antidote protein VapI